MKIGKYIYYLNKAFLWQKNKRVSHFTRRESELLTSLINANGDTVSLVDFYKYYNGDRVKCASTFRALITNLRAKLKEAGCLIQNDRERGYYLIMGE